MCKAIGDGQAIFTCHSNSMYGWMYLSCEVTAVLHICGWVWASTRATPLNKTDSPLAIKMKCTHTLTRIARVSKSYIQFTVMVTISITSYLCHAWWHKPAFGRWRQEAQEPKVILSYTVSSRSAWAMWDPGLKLKMI